jgi:hypothetical protein
MVAISRELQAMIDAELAKELSPPPPSEARWDRISCELWRMIDEEQLKDLPSFWDDQPDQPVYLTSPLSPEQATAADEADKARRRMEAKLAALHERRAPRALNCGKGRALHLRRDRDGGVEDGLFRFSCGRSDCPHCWRRRLTKTYRRSAFLLDADGESRLPRVGLLHVGEVDWIWWETFDRAMRRQHRGCADARGRRGLGRLRIRRSDNCVLIVSERPFRGSRPVTPAEAFEIASAAIDELHTARHAYRQLGKWADRHSTEWRLVDRVGEPLDFGTVQVHLAELGIRSKHFQNRDLAALLWRAESEAAADMLFAQLLHSAEGCPTFANGGKKDRFSHCPKSDTPPDADLADDEGDPCAVPDPSEYDPGANPWG